jgi:shikimate dehydrogenase
VTLVSEEHPLWLVGRHIDESRSPAMQNAGLAALGLPQSYALRPTEPDELDAVLDEAEGGCRGVNITSPYKHRVAQRYAAHLDELATRAGAANTVVFEEGRCKVATNTDVAGMLEAWRRASLNVLGRSVAIVGGGGAARAAVVAAKEAGAEQVLIWARRREPAEALVALARDEGLRASLDEAGAGRAHLLVSAIPTVDKPEELVARWLKSPGVVHDLRYGPVTHPLRNAALRAGHLFVDGTTMLLAQGVGALEAFVGGPLPPGVREAMGRALAAFRK